MLYELLFLIAIGIISGLLTGLIPGVHVNLVALGTVSIASFLLDYISITGLVVFITSMSITHSFINTIPSIFLGAPESGTSLSVLPGHKMLLEGEGLNAVKLTLLGSICGLIICFFSFLLLEWIIERGYELVEDRMFWLLLISSLFIVFRNKEWLTALLIFLLSGLLGLIVLNSSIEEPLFPLLSGLFGISTLIFSLQGNSFYPEQKPKAFKYNLKKGYSSVLLGTISGFITSILPGLGSSTAAAMTSVVKSENDTRDFLVLIGSITTVNFFGSIAALSVIDRARNGAVVAIQSLTEEASILSMIIASLIAAGVAVILSPYIAKLFMILIEKVKYEYLVYVVVTFIILMTLGLVGFKGIYVLLIASLIGLYANYKGTPRNVMMSCILMPVMLFFL